MSQHHALIKNDPRWHAARQACLERDGHTCLECGATSDLQADHILALSVVLADPELHHLAFDLDNLQTLCGSCNRAKADRVEGQVVRQTWVNPKWPELFPVLQALP